jgi:ATP-dependent DNA helicase 2 subunit 2
VAVVRFVKRMNDRPLLGILIPVVKADVEAFYFNQLPFEEDIREFSFAGLDDVRITANQKDAAEQLIRSMNLMAAGPAEDGDEPGEALIPKYTFNPALQRFYQCVERRALDPSADISELDPNIARYIVPSPSLLRQAAPKLANFKSAFDLRPVEENEKKKKRHWKDWYSEEVRDSDIEELRKRARGGESDAGGSAAAAAAAGSATPSQGSASIFSLEAAVADVIDHVGPLRPVSDFESMLTRRDDPTIVSRAMDELSARIRDSLQHSYMGSEYSRAFDCIIALRAASVRFEEAEKFNSLLGWLKKECAPTVEKPRPKHADFYAKLQQGNVLPIHEGEVSTSTVNESDAKNFYTADVQLPSAPIPAAAAAADADDLFDSME